MNIAGAYHKAAMYFNRKFYNSCMKPKRICHVIKQQLPPYFPTDPFRIFLFRYSLPLSLSRKKISYCFFCKYLKPSIMSRQILPPVLNLILQPIHRVKGIKRRHIAQIHIPKLRNNIIILHRIKERNLLHLHFHRNRLGL